MKNAQRGVFYMKGSVMKTIYRYNGPMDNDRILRVDDEVAIWAARMCVGEGGTRCSKDKASAMLWALLNRWFLHPGRRHWPTFLYLMRRFSQPINPRWQKGGDLARKYAGTPHCTPARLRRRAWVSNLMWDEIPAQIVNVVDDFREGRLKPPFALTGMKKPRISNWASHKSLPRKYPHGVAFTKSKQPDWFFEERNLVQGHVVVDYWGE